MSATVILLSVVLAAAIVAFVNDSPAPLQDDETNWP
jgi:hypothetical protein